MNIYDIVVKNRKKENVNLSDYKGKVLLIVNTATGCGFTPQYEGLQKLYDKYQEAGLEILNFPCNQFFNQAPGSNEEIVSFCKLTYGTTFKTFAKIDVNGEQADPLYKYLKEQAPQSIEDEAAKGLEAKLSSMGFKTEGSDIKWNFTKFLINREGEVVGRFAPTLSPEVLEEEIKKLL